MRSGPSVIAPKANKDEYLNFQLGLLILPDTKSMTWSKIWSPLIIAIAFKQHPEDSDTLN